MYVEPPEEYSFEHDPTAKALEGLEHDPSLLDKQQLLVLVHGLANIVTSLRKEVLERDYVIDLLSKKLELAEMVAEEERKFEAKTGLLTASAFREMVEETTERIGHDSTFGRRPNDLPKSNYLVYIDLDDFGDLNTALNNNVVDQLVLLPAVGRILKAVREDEDIVCRHGGDEFLVFLKDVSEIDARLITKRIRSHINAVSIPQTDRNPNLGSRLGASIGVTEFPIDAKYDDVFDLAHTKHINSKRSGYKNEIHFANDELPS